MSSIRTLNAFIAGTFASSPSGDKGTTKIQNELAIDVTVVKMNTDGTRGESVDVKANKEKSTSASIGDQWVVLDKASGGWIRSVTINADGEFNGRRTIKEDKLLDIGDKLFDPPALVDQVPEGPTPVVVGIGEVNGRQVIQSLMWRAEEPIDVPAGSEFKDVSVTETSGTTLTESESNTLATEVGISFTAEADLFLGKVSSTISAKISTQSTFARSLALTQSVSETTTVRFAGLPDRDVVVFRFQLVSVLTLLKNGKVTIQVETDIPRFTTISVPQ